MIKLVTGISDEHLERLYQSEEIKRTGDDFRSAEPIDHPLVNYYSVFQAKTFLGAFICVQFSRVEVELHSLLLHCSVKFSRKAMKLMLNTIFSDVSVSRVTGWIRSDYKTIINHGLKLGFVVEGVKRCGAVKDGKNMDVVLMGMTRDDWEKLVWVL